MRKLIFTAAIAICFAACSKSDKTPDKPIEKTAADVNLKTFLGYMNENLSSAVADFKNNIDTQLVSDNGTVLGVQLNDSAQAAAPLYVFFSSENNVITSIYIGVIGSSTLAEHQNLAKKYGNLSESLCGEVLACGTFLESDIANVFPTLEGLWDYISDNGYLDFDSYAIYWNYQSSGVIVTYSNSDGFVWGATNTGFETNSSSFEKNAVKVMRSFRP